MNKFHVNQGGTPESCPTPEACNLGGENVHYNSLEEAQGCSLTKNKKNFGLLSSITNKILGPAHGKYDEFQ